MPRIQRLELASMSKPGVRNGVYCLNLITTFLVLQGLLLPSGLIFVSSQSTNISFPRFNGENGSKFIKLGDAVAQNSSIDLNSYDYTFRKAFSVGKFLYPEMVRVLDPSTGQVASFSTSYSFEIILNPPPNPPTDPDGRYKVSDGLAFTLATDNSTIVPSGAYHNGEILCMDKANPTIRLFAVEIDTWLDPSDFDPSDSHIAVDINSAIHSNGYSFPEFVHNLCQPPQNTSFCGYFVNNPGPFTVWVDYDGPTQMIEVRFSPGLSATKPSPAIIRNKLDLSKVLNEFMYVGFSGSYGIYGEIHRILSWNFSSSGLSSASIPPPQALSPSPYSHGSANRSSNLGLIAGIISGLLGVCVTIVLGVFLCFYCRRQKKNQGYSKSTLKLGPRIFTYQELSKATKGFSDSELLGSGGFGAVYKGTFRPSGAIVAVKRCIKPDKPHAEAGFVAEATSVSQIRHRNLVQLQGWCQDRGQLLLVYDYMPNGSLDAWLFKTLDESVALTWDLRRNILAGVASALAYLHEELDQCVLHRDIKSSNVLLDSEFNAHLGDFGLARLIDHRKPEKTTVVAGTQGYMAPEMSYTHKATKETDVYSFGVLILEVVSGRRPLNMRAPNPDDIVLVDCVWRAHEAGDLLSVADPRLSTGDLIASSSECVSDDALLEASREKSSKPISMKDVLRLGLLCCQLNPSKRPSMRLVNHMFQTGDGAGLRQLPSTKPPMPGFNLAGSINPEVLSSITSPLTSGVHEVHDSISCSLR
ncbi:hypothetical protein KC19_9G066300 [Ceratodon purpureus]|uniref:Protein kinase domain-containing protein n=2 Tax=Ceratodon purpureus TaxID=3225 RepID=A0A8T0GX25_CERPU|nr:hypothetical protein KC19_9G066300 [Ceratodon purpureus]